MSARPAARLRLERLLFIVGIVIAGGWAGSAWGQAPIVRVEQDWELVVGEPRSVSSSPQIVCMISPTAGTGALYAAFELNHQSLPQYSPGGMQLQLWNGEQLQVEANAADGYKLESPGEVIRWTQVMDVSTGRLVFSVINGTSSTWGNFGNGLVVETHSPHANLRNYSTATSVEHSGVTFAPHRVQSLVIKRVRLLRTNGQTSEDATEHVVHRHE
jgi:hypothetical protein